MKKNIFFTLVLLLPLLFACNREQTAGGNIPDEEGLIQTEFSFKAERSRNIAVRATEIMPDGNGGIQMTLNQGPATREGSLTTDQEDVIHNVWVLQFDGTGKFVRKEFVPSPEEITDDNGVRYRVKVRLYIQEDCTVYFVANRPGINWQSYLTEGVSTLNDFKNCGIEMWWEDEVIKDNMIPMAGHYEGPVPNKVYTVIDMTRMVAKIVFTMNYRSALPDNYTLVINSVQLVNVPTVASYYNGGEIDTEWKYPDVSDPDMLYNLIAYQAMMEYSGFTANTDHTFTWYVPENRRGVNDDIDHQKNKWKGNDPSIMEGGFSAAMRIVMKGTYTKQIIEVNSFPGTLEPGSHDFVSPNAQPPIRPNPVVRDITINLHPGRDIVNDYNVVRNSVYNLRANIQTIQDDDLRVEFNPMVTYRYFYEDPDEDGLMRFLAADYITTMEIGDEIPIGDPIPNAKKSLIPANGHTYRDGQVFSSPYSVSEEDNWNVVEIRHYRDRPGPFYVDVYWLRGYQTYDYERFGPYTKGTVINPHNLWFPRYSYQLPGDENAGYYFQGSETTSTLSGFYYDVGDIEIVEDLTVKFRYDLNPT